LLNNNITGNEANSGGGLYVNAANVVVINTIIWGNIASSGASVYEQGITALEVRYSDVEGNDVWPGEGNMNEEPQFLSDGYHLEDTSPLVNEGISTIIINGERYTCPPYDIDGEVRPYANTRPEIGVDEVPVFTVGMPVSTKSQSLNIYPNPSDRLVTISVNNGAATGKVTIYNQIGKDVYRGIPNENTIDVSNLQSGIYIVEVSYDQSRFRGKLIVE
jgi:hypothetical protein